MKSQLDKFCYLDDDFEAMSETNHFYYCQAYCVSSMSLPVGDALMEIDVQMANECGKAGIIFA